MKQRTSLTDRKSQRRRKMLATVAGLTALTAAGARATDRMWIGLGTTDWNTPGNWLGIAVPTSNDIADIVNNDAFVRVVNYDYPGPAITLNNLLVSNTGGGTTTFTMGGSNLTAINATVGGSGGSGVFNLNGGVVTLTQQLFLGANGGAGIFNLNGGTINVSSEENIGTGGSGVFTQIGGTNNAINILDVGIGGTGTYGLRGGSLSAFDEDVAVFGSNGTINRSGGVNTVNAIRVGAFGTGGVGMINISGGTVNAADVLLGGYGTAAVAVGILNSTGGSLTASDGITIYNSSVGSNVSSMTLNGGAVTTGFITAPDWSTLTFTRGTLTLQGGTSSNTGSFSIGSGTGVATLNQTGGTVSIAGSLNLGNGGGGTANYNLSAGTLSTGGQENIGNGSTGVFTQTGGSHIAQFLVDIGINGSTSAGTYNLQLGLFSAASEDIATFGARGTFNQSGGTNNAGEVRVGAFGTGGIGTVNLSGGTLSTFDVLLGGYGTSAAGVGTLNATGGTLNVASGITVYNASIGSNVSGITINGGTVTAAFITAADWNRFNFVKGTMTLQGGTSSNTGDLTIGNAGGLATLTQNGGEVDTSGSVIVGSGTGGKGVYNQKSGNVTVAQNLFVGNFASGTYTLSSGLLMVVGGQSFIGYGGSGTFTQTGGTHNASFIQIGNTGPGTYLLQNGSINALAEDMALNGGISTFTQTGGTNNVQAIRDGSFGAGGTGTINLSGGTLNVSDTIYLGGVGTTAVATGIFNVSGGTAIIANAIQLYGTTGSSLNISAGSVTTSNTYFGGQTRGTLSASGLLAVNGEEAIGPGSVLFTQSGGSNQIFGSLEISGSSSATSAFSLQAGTLSSTYGEYVGYQSDGAGILAQSGGSNTIAVILSIGTVAGATGTVNLSGGDLTAVNVAVGGNGVTSGGTGTLSITGGFLNATNISVLNSSSLLSLNGGTVSTAAIFLTPDWSRLNFLKGSLNLTGGVSSNSGALNVTGSGGLATLNLNGGALYATSISLGSAGSATLNVSSGSLTASGAFTVNNSSALSITGGTVSAASLANAATVTESSGTVSISGLVSNAGTLFIGGGTGAATMTVGSIAQTTVTVTAGGTLTIGTLTGAPIPWGTNPGGFNPHPTITPGAIINNLNINNNGVVNFATTVGTGNPYVSPFAGTVPTNRITHQVGTLSLPYSTAGGSVAFVGGGNLTGTIAPAGTLDIANQQLLLNTPTAQSVRDVQLLVAAGYNASAYGAEDGKWDGKGVTSSVAKSSYVTAARVSKFAVGYAYGGDASTRAEQGGGVDGTNTNLDGVGLNQTLVRTVLLGDVNMDGIVDFADISSILGYHYNDNQPAHYTDGDINNHGVVNFDDISLVLAFNYNSSQNFPSQTAAQAQAKALLFKSTASAIRRSAVVAVASAGIPDFTYNPNTGDIAFILNGYAPTATDGTPSFVTSISISSTDGLLISSNANKTFATAIGATFSTNLMAGALTSGPGFGDGHTVSSFDLGDVLPTGLSLSDVESELTLQYQVMNDGLLQTSALAGSVPEPAGLALVGLGAIELLARRRLTRVRKYSRSKSEWSAAGCWRGEH